MIYISEGGIYIDPVEHTLSGREILIYPPLWALWNESPLFIFASTPLSPVSCDPYDKLDAQIRIVCSDPEEGNEQLVRELISAFLIMYPGLDGFFLSIPERCKDFGQVYLQASIYRCPESGHWQDLTLKIWVIFPELNDSVFQQLDDKDDEFRDAFDSLGIDSNFLIMFKPTTGIASSDSEGNH